MDVTDLDILVPEPKRIKLGGVEYRVPADLPMEIFLRINQAASYKNEDGTDDQVKQLNSLLDSLTDLVLWETETTDEDVVKAVQETVQTTLRRRGVRYCFGLVNAIYAPEEVDGEVVGGDAGPPAQAQPGEDSSGTKSLTTSPSPTTPQ